MAGERGLWSDFERNLGEFGEEKLSSGRFVVHVLHSIRVSLGEKCAYIHIP